MIEKLEHFSKLKIEFKAFAEAKFRPPSPEDKLVVWYTFQISDPPIKEPIRWLRWSTMTLTLTQVNCPRVFSSNAGSWMDGRTDGRTGKWAATWLIAESKPPRQTAAVAAAVAMATRYLFQALIEQFAMNAVDSTRQYPFGGDLNVSTL